MKKLAIMAALMLVFSGAALAQVSSSDDQESSDINVTVASEVAVDVKPDSLDFTDIQVGSQQTESDNLQSGIEISNVGSEDINRIWFEASKPNNRPFGTGTASNYDAGNFFQIKPADGTIESNLINNMRTEAQDNYHYVNKKEFTMSEAPTYIKADASEVSGFGETDVGRMRAGEYSFFYVLAHDGGDQCNSGELRLGETPHTPSSTGTINFEDSDNDGDGTGSDYATYQLSGAPGTTEYAITDDGPNSAGDGVILSANFNGSVGAQNRSYDVLATCADNPSNGDGPHTIRSHYNIFAAGADDLTNSGGVATEFMLDTAGNNLNPGEGVTIDTAVEVPQGVAQGQVTEGTVTARVTSDADPAPTVTGVTNTSSTDIQLTFDESVDVTDDSGFSVNGSVSTTSISGSGSSTLTLTVGSDLTAGNVYEVTYNGNDGNVVESDNDNTPVNDFTETFTAN